MARAVDGFKARPRYQSPHAWGYWTERARPDPPYRRSVVLAASTLAPYRRLRLYIQKRACTTDSALKRQIVRSPSYRTRVGWHVGPTLNAVVAEPLSSSFHPRVISLRAFASRTGPKIGAQCSRSANVEKSRDSVNTGAKDHRVTKALSSGRFHEHIAQGSNA